jgi:Mg-chelatase subunit ChlD
VRIGLLSFLLLGLSGLFLPRAVCAGGGELAAVRRLLEDPSPSARAAALRRLAGDESPPALALLSKRLGDPHPYVRRAVAGVLGQVLGVPARRKLVQRLRRHRDPVVRAEACRSFALWVDALGRGALEASLRDAQASVRLAALRWLAPLLPPEDEAGARLLLGLLADRDGGVRAEVLLLMRGRVLALPGARLQGLCSDSDARVRLAALESSVAVSEEVAVVAILRGLTDAVWSVRLAAAELSREVRVRRVLGALPPLLDDERMRIRAAAHAALIDLSGIPFAADAGKWRAWLETEGATFDPKARAPRRRRESRFDTGTETVVGARFLGLSIESRHAAFVLDVSGSMKERVRGGETRWAVVAAALSGVLGQLKGRREKAQVNVITFGDEARAFFESARPLTAARLGTIERRLAATVPAGRTALFDGIALALSDPEVDTLVVLSDGAPSAGAFFTKTDLLTEVARLNRWRRARIDVIAVGSDRIAKRWRDVMKRLAKESGGRFVARN